MNAWGIVIIALAGGLLWWAVKHEGTLADLGAALGLAALAGKAATSATGSGSNEKSAGSAADDAGSAAEDLGGDVAAGL